jgi:hypothetical protein
MRPLPLEPSNALMASAAGALLAARPSTPSANGHPITSAWHGQDSFWIKDELYRWRRDPRGTQDVNVLLSLDETTVREGIQESALPYVHRQPIAWTKTFRGASRVYYTNLGHNESTWDRADFRQSLLAGIQWVGGVRPDAECFSSGGSKTTGVPSFRYPDQPVADVYGQLMVAWRHVQEPERSYAIQAR